MPRRYYCIHKVLNICNTWPYPSGSTSISTLLYNESYIPCSWFQTFAKLWMLNAFSWVIPIWIPQQFLNISHFTPIRLWRWNGQSVLKCRHIKFRCWGIPTRKHTIFPMLPDFFYPFWTDIRRKYRYSTVITVLLTVSTAVFRYLIIIKYENVLLIGGHRKAWWF
jgi:hypothetical protein